MQINYMCNTLVITDKTASNINNSHHCSDLCYCIRTITIVHTVRNSYRPFSQNEYSIEAMDYCVVQFALLADNMV